MTWPNFITFGRLFSVPFIVWLILSEDYRAAFALTFVAGISDILDGVLARLLKDHSNLGAYLDPFADKMLLIGIYGALAIKNLIPLWLVIAVIFRDIVILGGILSLLGMKKNLKIRPLMVSKINTFFQILTGGMILAQNAYSLFNPELLSFLFNVTLFTTLISAFGYMHVLSSTLKEDV